MSNPIRRYLRLPCGHDAPFLKLADPDEPGLPACPECGEVVRQSHRLRGVAAQRKAAVLKVFDRFFALRSGLEKRKRRVLELVEGATNTATLSIRFLGDLPCHAISPAF